MMCPYAGENYKNKEGWFTPTVKENHPWHNKLFCIDWDAQCILCMENQLEQAKNV